MKKPRRWQDTSERYGRISRWLHWGIAVLLLLQFVTVLGWRWLGNMPLTQALSMIAPHGLVGMAVFALMMARVTWAWRMRMVGCRPIQLSTTLGRAAMIGHVTLNVLTLFIPGSAMLRAWASGRGMEVWGVRWLPGAGQQLPLLEAPADLLHSTLAWALLVMALGHGGAAVLHHTYADDGVIRRML